MITFSQLGNHGRLGNQLFQYAFLKSIELTNGNKVVLDKNLKERVWHGQNCLLENFKLTCEFSDKLEIKSLFVEPKHRSFSPIVYTFPEGTDYFGYYQNINYFHRFRKEILKEFELKDEIIDKAKSILSKYRDKKIVSVHFRRGDSITMNPLSPNYLNSNGEMDDECLLGKYINEATSIFNEDDVYFYVISGGSREGDNREDIEWCKKNFKRKNVIYSEGVEDIVEFAILTLVDYNICSHGSTFGWWGAYLNKNQCVIAPKDANLDSLVDPASYYPNNWKLI